MKKYITTKKSYVAVILIVATFLFSGSFLLLSKPVSAASTFNVNVNTDEADNNVGDGICETANTGECTLRAALEENNANNNDPAVDNISFGISGAGAHVITPATPLPIIHEPVNIDGSTQGSINCTTHSLLIEIDGSSMGEGFSTLDINTGSDGSTVHGMAVTGAQPSLQMSGYVGGLGILVFQSDGNTLTCNNVGVKADGTTANGSYDGIFIDGNSNQIGGPNTSDGNLTSNMTTGGMHLNCPNTANVFEHNYSSDNSGSGLAIAPDCTDTVIKNNTFTENETGVSSEGSADTLFQNNLVTNNTMGMDLRDELRLSLLDSRITDNGAGIQTIGGQLVSIVNNVIGDNSATGLQIDGGSDNSVQGNFIGVDDDGTTLMPNNSIGIQITAGTGGSLTGTVIGGTTEAERNIITGNNITGILFLGLNGANDLANNSIIGNYIGMDGSGAKVGNDGTGITILGSVNDNTIGGTSAGSANVITGNTAGIFVSSSTGASLTANSNAFLRNKIYDNDKSGSVGMGIDLANDSDANFSPDQEIGVTANDAGDTDANTNYYQNNPEISAVSGNGSKLDITYNLDVNPAQDSATAWRVEFYANDTANPSGNGDGQYYLGTETVTGDVTDHLVSLSGTGLSSGTYSFSATATVINDSDDGFGSTSEYGPVLGASVVLSSDTSGGGNDNSQNNSNSDSQGDLGETGDRMKSPILLASILVLSLSLIVVIRRKSKIKL